MGGKALLLSIVGLSALIIGVVFYAVRIEPNRIEIERVDVPIAHLPPALEGLTIVQLSDIHLGPWVGQGNVRRAVQLANSLHPDLVVLTGDFVYRSADYAVPCAQELSRLQSRYGIYAVLGNHDLWEGADEVAENLRRVGIEVLRDGRVAIGVKGARLWLLGVDDPGYGFTKGWRRDELESVWEGGLPWLRRTLRALPPDEVKVLLLHNPDFARVLPKGVDLVLSGHSHGGQVRLPFLGPLFTGVRRENASGLRREGNAWLYVNRGIGVIFPPVRFLCRPEITLLRLMPSG
ncbi:MAG: metallophosphoesterase [Chloroflexota bacterium]|nr:metallophosphoesterase [Chloroflexota bacterium]